MTRRLLVLAAMALLSTGCFKTNLKLFTDAGDPLEEVRLRGGEGKDKVLLVPVVGVIGTETKSMLLGTRASLVQEVVAQLEKAAKDSAVKAVILQIDSPGGSATASDILYREIERFKERSGAKVVALFQETAASGGYYVALASDRIVAHPTTTTGSIGVIFIRAKAKGLMDKIGLDAEVTKSGAMKDMGAIYRETTAEEKAVFQAMIDETKQRFLDLVGQRRGIKDPAAQPFADARILTAAQAKAAGLVDRVGYLEDALAEARGLAGLGADAPLVAYRRERLPEDNPYNTPAGSDGGLPHLFSTGLERFLAVPRTGVYYLWAPEYP